MDVLKALDHLHDQNIVHSDIQLANIVFTQDTSYLIDFDLADKEGILYPGIYAELMKGTRVLVRTIDIH